MKGVLAIILMATVQPLFAQSPLNCTELGLDEVFKADIVVSEEFNKGPVVGTHKVFFNPCAPIQQVDGCPEDDHFCLVKSINHKGEGLVFGVLPFGSETRGASIDFGSDILGMDLFLANGTIEAHFKSDDERSYIHYIQLSGAQWGDVTLNMVVELKCDRDATEPMFKLHPNGYSSIHMSAICAWERKHMPPIDQFIQNEIQSYSAMWKTPAYKRSHQQAWFLAMFGASTAIVLSGSAFLLFKKRRMRKATVY